jgi:NADH-quinone oxidoreductase subunit N
MNTLAPRASIPPIGGPVALAVALFAALLLIAATALALRPRAAAHSFAWIVVAAFAYPLLALASALRAPESGGLRAAGLQLLAVLLAAVLGALLPARAGEQNPACRPAGRSLPCPLSAAARAFAWFTLVGLPPTVGFHGKVAVYRALLGAGWGGLAALAMAGSAAALLPALWAIRSPHPSSLSRPRALLALGLIAIIVVLGLYPEAGLAVARLADTLGAVR